MLINLGLAFTKKIILYKNREYHNQAMRMRICKYLIETSSTVFCLSFLCEGMNQC